MEQKVIRQLSAYEEDWSIKVRVLRKSLRETYYKDNRKIDILRLILIDEEGDKIQATLFNELIDKFYEVLETGKSYIVRNANVRAVKETYQNVNDKIELSFKAATEIEEIDEHIFDIVSNSFVQFNDISNFTDGSTLFDVMGMVVKVKNSFVVNVKKPKERTTKKREVILLDGMSNTIKLDLWGDLADNEGKILEDIVMLRPMVAAFNVKAGYYQDELHLSTSNVGVIEINPKLEENEAIKKSLLSDGGFYNVFGPTKRMMDAMVVKLDDIITSNVDKLYCTFVGKIVKVQNKSNPWYETCTQCNSRVYPEADKQFAACIKCVSENLPFTRKYLLKLIVSDGNQEVYATLFDAAEYIVGCTVNKYAESILNMNKKESSDHYKTLVMSENKQYKFLVRMDAKKREERARKRFVVEEVYKIEGDAIVEASHSTKKIRDGCEIEISSDEEDTPQNLKRKYKTKTMNSRKNNNSGRIKIKEEKN